MCNNKVKDILGIEPLSEAGYEITKGTIESISAFLNCVFKPGLEELGYLTKDKIRYWRLKNIIRTLEKAKGKMTFDGQSLQLTANARVGLSIMEGCSVVDNQVLQNMWAGLFVSSCTEDGYDDSNMNFVDLLKRMSSVEAKIIDYSCPHCMKILYPNKLIASQRLMVTYEKLVEITGVDDVYRLDHEMDHMRSMELLETGDTFTPGGGFSTIDNELSANITPSPMALNLYYKTHSNGKSQIELWGDKLTLYKVNEKKK